MEVSIDRGGCIGCGLCTGICPEVFEMASDGLAQVHNQPAPAQEASAKEAADNCPVGVISAS